MGLPPRKLSHLQVRAVNLLPVLVLGLSACGTLDGGISRSQDADIQTEELLSNDEVRQYVQEWRQAKAGIQRLNELEADLALLISEVNRSSDIEETPVPYREVSEDAVISAEPVSPSQNTTGSQSTSINLVQVTETAPEQQPDKEIVFSEKIVGLRIATFLKPRSAEFGWYLIQQRDGGMLSGLSAKLQKLEQPRQTLYGLNLGPFASAPEAQHLCEKLKPRQYVCEVGEFSGEELL